MSAAGTGAGRVALVTGGSRGVGRGIARGLGEAGWTVYVTGRGTPEGDTPLARAAQDVTDRGGVGHGRTCDHGDDDQVRELVDSIVAEQGRIDLLVNNVWVGPAVDPNVHTPFWERPVEDWALLVDIGLRSHYVAAHAAAQHMVAAGSGLIVNISSFGSRGYLHSVAYGISKAGLDKMANDMARELKPHGVQAVSLWPGLILTDSLLERGIESVAGVSVADGETPELQGRIIAALAADETLAERSGSAFVAAEAAAHYGITEEGGRSPRSLRDLFGGGPLFDPVP